MIFSELYSAYYNAVAGILKAAVDHPLQKDELREIIRKNAFGESILNIEPAMTEERWQLLHSDGTTPLQHKPSMPLTTLQKRWLKAIYADQRIGLFTDDIPDIPDVEPLFTAEDIYVFDKYSDGDPYNNEEYRNNFRRILDAIEKQYPLSINMATPRGKVTYMNVMPKCLEYSEKDDKFRLIGAGCKYGGTINIARIVCCKPYTKPYKTSFDKKPRAKNRIVEFEITDRRNALERVLLHFAHFEKQAEKIDDEHYKVTLNYDKEDESEIVIRILSFGPMVKVTAPQHFIDLIKEKLINQKSCGI